MPEVHETPQEGQGMDPSADRPALNWQDPEEVERWFEALRDAILDGLAAGQDATRRLKKRLFSRHEARRRIDEAEQNVLALLDAAKRGQPALQGDNPTSES